MYDIYAELFEDKEHMVSCQPNLICVPGLLTCYPVLHYSLVSSPLLVSLPLPHSFLSFLYPFLTSPKACKDASTGLFLLQIHCKLYSVIKSEK